MKKLTLSLLTLLLMFVAAVALWAADVWVAKPYTDWNEKDIQKIMTDSPWAKTLFVTFENVGRGGKGGGGGRGDGGGGGGGKGGGGQAPESELTIRWQTAPTILQALVKLKFRDEAGTPDAKKELEPDEMYYIIWVAGLPGRLSPRDDDAKNALLQVTTLSSKDKGSITATDLEFPPAQGGRGAARNSDARFSFPRKIVFSADDKEIEFATKFGKDVVKMKFPLKAMMINGKLGL